MDFSQRYKINSSLPIQNRAECCKCMENNIQNRKYLDRREQTCPQIMPSHHSNGNINKNCNKCVSKPYSQPSQLNTSDENCLQIDSSFHLRKPSNNLKQAQQSDAEIIRSPNDIDIERFQCTPTTKPPLTTKETPKQFKPVIETMRRYTSSCPQSEIKSSKMNCETNQQLIFPKHANATVKCEEDADDEEIMNMPYKYYRSHTKIVTIPNGVKIITEIKKDDNRGNECENDEYEEQLQKSQQPTHKCDKINYQHCVKKCHDKWLNKMIEITLGDNDEVKRDDDDDECECNDVRKFC